MKNIMLFILLAILAAGTHAQEEDGAFAAAGGIIVYLNDHLYSPSQPDDGVTHILIERKGDGESAWKEIADVSSPENVSQFETRLKESVRALPYKIPGLESRASGIWQEIQAWNKGEGNGKDLLYVPVQLAMGMAYYDRTAAEGKVYTYKVSQKKSDNSTLEEFQFSPTAFPVQKDFGFSYSGKEVDFEGLTLVFKLTSEKFPSIVQLYRQDKIDGDFKEVEAKYTFRGSEGETTIAVVDGTAEPFKIYKYMVKPMDQYGNSGSQAETPVIGNYDFTRQAPVVTEFNASNEAGSIGTKLTWKYQNYDLVSVVRVMRSESTDGPFEMIAELPRNAFSYIDQTIRPMTRYYYYLQVIGPMGEVAPQSIRVHAYYEDAGSTVPPVIRETGQDKDGIGIEVEVKDIHTSGVVLYRGYGRRDVLEVLTDLLPPRDGVVSFKDNKLGDQPADIYYSAVAVSTSHVNSPFSDTLQVYWSGKASSGNVDAPGGLTAEVRNMTVVLTWDGPKDESGIAGYLVFRKDGDAKDFLKLTEEAVPFNNYNDRSVEAGITYQYMIMALYTDGRNSGLSNSVLIKPEKTELIAPTRVQALQTSEGIVIEWSPVDQKDFNGYAVYRYERGSKPVRLGLVDRDVKPEYIDKTAKSGNLYFYQVSAVGEEGLESPLSSEAGIRIK